MGKRLADGFEIVEVTSRLVVDALFGKAFPDVVDGLLGGMQEVRTIEAVVAELVELDLVGGEIGHLIRMTALHSIDRHEEHSLGQAALMEAVFGVAIGRYGEDDLRTGEKAAQRLEGGGALVNRQRTFDEGRRRTLVAIAHDKLIGTSRKAVVAIGAEGDDDGRRIPFNQLAASCEHSCPARLEGRSVGVAVGEPAMPTVVVVLEIEVVRHRVGCQHVQDAQRVIEHAKRIDERRQTALAHLRADVFSKARTDESHTIMQIQRTWKRWYLYGSNQFHATKIGKNVIG